MGKSKEDTDNPQIEICKPKARYMNSDINKQEAKKQLDELVPLRSEGFLEGALE
jgi:hypothetical protein